MNTTAVSPKESVVRIFICYRREDGAWLADWLYKALNSVEFRDASGRDRSTFVYYDVTAPGVADWKALHFPSLQSSQALLLLCTPGIVKDLSRSNRPDWVYKELQWWVANRSVAPIVIDATDDADRWMPEIVLKKWPNINRIPVKRDVLSVSTGASDLVISLRDRILATIRESEHATTFEDLDRLRKVSRRLAGLLVVSIVLTLVSAIAVGFAMDARRIAEEKTTEANQNLKRAEEEVAIGTAQAWKLYQDALNPQLIVNGDINRFRRSNTGALVRLIHITIENKDSIAGAKYAIKILQCFGPHRGEANRVAFDALFKAFKEVKGAELQIQLNRLKAIVESDQIGAKRPYSKYDRCDWMNRFNE